MMFERSAPFSELFTELGLAAEMSERLLRPLPLVSDHAERMGFSGEESLEAGVSTAPEAPAPRVGEALGTEVPSRDTAPRSSGPLDGGAPASGLAAFTALLEWSEQVANAQASMLTDRGGLLIASHGLMLNEEAAQTYGARLAVMLDQVERFEHDDDTGNLVYIRIGSFWLSATQLHLSDEQPVILCVIGPQPAQINFAEVALEKLRTLDAAGFGS